MLKNYLKTSWRNLRNNKLFSFINISGLAVGIAVSMLIILYVGHESNYDSFHKNADRIFWIEGESKIGNQTTYSNQMGYYDGPILKQADPTVESFVRTTNAYEDVVIQAAQNNHAKFFEKKFLFADSNFFNFFSFQLIRGDKNEALKNPFSIVISKQTAKKYFGDADPIGRILQYNNKYNFSVTGVVQNPASNSSIDFDFLAPLSAFAVIKNDMVSSQPQIIQTGFVNTYLLLNKPSDASGAENSLNKLAKEASSNAPMQDLFHVMLLKNFHLNPNISTSTANKYLNAFAIIAIAVLLLAIINYVGLSTARSTLRAKEVGVRKVIGAEKRQIAMQFIVESFIYSFIAFFLGYMICTVVQPAFFNFLQIYIDNSFLRSPQMLTAFLILFLITVILSSSYPSVLLSGFNPSAVLYGKLSKQSGGAIIRKFFIVFQFALCTILIICGLVIQRQLYFFKHKETGINRNRVVMLPFGSLVGKHFESFRNDIKSVSTVQKISVAATALYQGGETYFTKPKDGKTNISISILHVDESFIPMLGLRWKFAPKDSISYLNQKTVMLNETAIEQLNLPNGGIDEKIGLGPRLYEVAGVLKDFNYESLQKKISPLGIIVNSQNDTLASWASDGGFLYAQIQPNANTPHVINELETVYKKYDSEKPFEYYFMDDAFNEMYKSEEKLSKLSEVFISITLFIACLGLFGLSAFIAQQRSKEISIRKVMGASSGKIITLLSKDFLQPVLIAILIASPIAWWLMNDWLQSFAYRINISVSVFLIAGLFAILIAMITVSSQAIRASFVNPIKSLRAE
jgi:putative ABC transport system permease protein